MGTHDPLGRGPACFAGAPAWAYYLTGCQRLESQGPQRVLYMPRQLGSEYLRGAALPPLGPTALLPHPLLLLHMRYLPLSQGCKLKVSAGPQSRLCGRQKGLVGTAVIWRVPAGSRDHHVRWEQSCQVSQFPQSRELSRPAQPAKPE